MLYWYFGPSGSEEHGPKDSITQTFKGNKYYSLAREVIQNSLDVLLDNSKPVVVKFSLFEISANEMPELFEVTYRYSKCSKKYSGDKPFLKFCENAEFLLKKNKLTCLKISDFNTKGMEHSDGDTNSGFYAFMSAVGVTSKASPGAGGSFGFGKGAYYAASPLRMITVSSVYNNNKFVFQGKARLTTHEDDKGQLSDYTGLFGAEKGKPVFDINELPEIFRRKERGTDVSIIGFNIGDNQWKESLIKSVLNNFWLSIWEERLIVEVDGIILNKSNLEQNILKYFFENSPDGSISEPENWNPYPYFMAIKYQSDKEYARKFQSDLPTLGKVNLYLFIKEKYPNRIMYVRSPKMVVYKKTDNRGVNYAGVFICENPAGNEILRQMENPQHNEWKKTNYLDGEDLHIDGKKAELELKHFIKESLSALSGIDTSNRQRIIGLEKYLSIPEDLLEQSENGNGESEGGIQLSTETMEKENGPERTFKKDLLTIKPKLINKTVAINSNGKINAEAEDDAFAARPSPNEDENPNPQPGNNKDGSVAKGNSNSQSQIKKPLKIQFRLLATKEPTGEIKHTLRVGSQNETFAEIYLFAGVDNDSQDDDSLEIKSASQGDKLIYFDGNKLKNVQLKSGWNDIDVFFDSNQKYCLKPKTYEL